jgi:hypothetical protein
VSYFSKSILNKNCKFSADAQPRLLKTTQHLQDHLPPVLAAPYYERNPHSIISPPSFVLVDFIRKSTTTVRLQTLIFPLRVGKHQYQKASLTPILEKSFFVLLANWVMIYNGLQSPKLPLMIPRLRPSPLPIKDPSSRT